MRLVGPVTVMRNKECIQNCGGEIFFENVRLEYREEND
jgi:hypothetical protein